MKAYASSGGDRIRFHHEGAEIVGTVNGPDYGSHVPVWAEYPGHEDGNTLMVDKRNIIEVVHEEEK